MPRSTPEVATTTTDPQSTFPLIGGRPCLNFVATLGRRHGTPLERLPDTDALTRWLTEAHLVPAAGDTKAATDAPPPTTPTTLTTTTRATTGELTDARSLREAVYRLLRAAMDGQQPLPEDVAQVNKVAADPDLAPQLAITTSESASLELTWRATNGVRAALSAVARDAALLVGGPLLDRVKECENPNCSLLFLDDSQARRRRWCSMDRCGNLAKVTGYRTRKRA
ncbi:CGNR zinc finger domain-containing protein [Kitasatospora sp. NPDC048239]|uniref:CGNR zinc finger domain-containing protein n=1 Tax=Kitasatospora sp. NPDC048239 TaxID=3364046 RepID=UPI00370FFBE3